MRDDDEDVQRAIRSFSRLARCEDDELRGYRVSFLGPSCAIEERRLAHCRDLLVELARALAADDPERWAAVDQAHAVFFPRADAGPPLAQPPLGAAQSGEPGARSPWAARQAGATPATPAPTPPPAPAPVAAPSRQALEPIAAHGQTTNDARPPVGPVLPFASSAEEAAEGWTLENWVALQAELRAQPSARGSVLSRYHLADEAALSRLEAAWRARLARLPGLQGRLGKLTADYERAMLARGPAKRR